jgi:hypothetical protein
LPTANELESIFQSRGWKANITSDYSILKARTESTGFCEPEPPGGQIVRLEVPIVLPEHGLNAMGQSSTVMMLLAASSEIFEL